MGDATSDSASAAAATAQPAPRRSALVSAAGIGLALFPWAVFVLALAATPHDSPLWIALRHNDFTSIDRNAIAISLAMAVVCGAAGLAMWRRWRGWRFYAGTAAWLLIANTVVSLRFPLQAAAWGIVDPWYLGMMSLPGCLGVVILAAKRMELPATPFSPVKLAGVLLILLGIVYALGAVFAPGLGLRIISAIGCVLLVDTGVRAIFRWRGWRTSLRALAWLMIVLGFGFAAAQLINALDGTVYWPAAVERAGSGLLVGALGCFVLWARRREPLAS